MLVNVNGDAKATASAIATVHVSSNGDAMRMQSPMLISTPMLMLVLMFILKLMFKHFVWSKTR